MLKHKSFSPFNYEQIKKAIDELNKERHEFVNITELIADDKFIVIYREGNKTLAPEEDIQKHSTHPSNDMDYAEERKDLISLAKEYWFIIIPVIIFVIWVFFFKGR